jgi:hypothetical protein
MSAAMAREVRYTVTLYASCDGGRNRPGCLGRQPQLVPVSGEESRPSWLPTRVSHIARQADRNHHPLDLDCAAHYD